MLRSSAWVFFSKLLAAVLNFTTIILLSRWLGAADRGVCSWYLVVITLSLVFSDLIAGPAAGFLLKDFGSKAIRLCSYGWSLLVSLITAVAFFVAGKLNVTEFFLLLALCWLNAASAIHLHLILAKKMFAWYNLLSVLSPLLTVLLLLVFFKTGHIGKTYYLLSLCIAWLASVLASVLLLLPGEKDLPPVQTKRMVIKGFRNGMLNQASHLIGLLNNRMVYFLLPAATLGVYANALSLAEAALMIPGSLGQVLYANSLHEEIGSGAFNKLLKSLAVSFLLLFIVFLLVCILPDSLYTFLFGKAFAGIKPLLVRLSAIVMLYGGYLVCSYWQSSQGRFVKNITANVAGFIINVLITAVLIMFKLYTVFSAVWALGAAYLVMFLLAMVLASRESLLPNLLLKRK